MTHQGSRRANGLRREPLVGREGIGRFDHLLPSCNSAAESSPKAKMVPLTKGGTIADVQVIIIHVQANNEIYPDRKRSMTSTSLVA